GYAYAAWRIDRAFPFIAIGLAGKILGPIGWLIAVRSHELPFRTFPLIVFDDLLWWLPFGMFLLEGTRASSFLKRTAPLWCAAAPLLGGAANGLYTLAGILLTLNTPGLPLRWLAWIAWLSGLALIIVTVLNVPIGVMIASAALMISFIPFVIATFRQ